MVVLFKFIIDFFYTYINIYLFKPNNLSITCVTTKSILIMTSKKLSKYYVVN